MLTLSTAIGDELSLTLVQVRAQQILSKWPHLNSADDPNTVPLSEEGYQKVAALKDDEAMLKFVRRHLDAVELRAKTEEKLRGWVSSLSSISGTKAKQSFDAMADDLRKVDWLIPNNISGTYTKAARRAASLRLWPPHISFNKADVLNTAPLSEDGYEKVAALKNDEAMLKFVRRYLDGVGLRATSTQQLKGWVRWFSGTTAKQSFQAMVDELRQVDWLIPNEITGTYNKEKLKKELRTAV